MESGFLSFKDFLLIQGYITKNEMDYNYNYFLPLYDLYKCEYEMYCNKNDYEYEEIN